ncbi:Acyl-CoA thioester hydrolase YbgC [Rubripirellula obstinata]|uniref:Acyl-CoA thioester hydrolase YbgC n=1 Tax=Rubripirellula obstinata TaxID=406547 RepID=A0A5B1CGE5_9BACT|nr:thioesterase family protein [Rubripirellula obstinata]KAA1258829.1 Acyl-CoA thioester hydrolase YbgC [Rubripirellula obstinata]
MTPETPDSTNPASWKFKQSFRVTYYETDGQRRVHHSNYLKYFERGRIEMLREAGIRYKDLEDNGFMLVVTEMNLRYQAAAEFDDLLTLTTTVTKIGKVRIQHHYAIDRDGQTIVEADSTIACIGKTGKPTRLPDCFFRN